MFGKNEKETIFLEKKALSYFIALEKRIYILENPPKFKPGENALMQFKITRTSQCSDDLIEHVNEKVLILKDEVYAEHVNIFDTQPFRRDYKVFVYSSNTEKTISEHFLNKIVENSIDK